MSLQSLRKDSLIFSVSVQFFSFLGFGCGTSTTTPKTPNSFYKEHLKLNGGLNLMSSPSYQKPRFKLGFLQEDSLLQAFKTSKPKAHSSLKERRPSLSWPVQKLKRNILKSCNSSLPQDQNHQLRVLIQVLLVKLSRSFPFEMITKMTASEYFLQ